MLTKPNIVEAQVTLCLFHHSEFTRVLHVAELNNCCCQIKRLEYKMKAT